MAEALVESLSDEFDPAKYHDDYREQVLDLISKKAAGEEFEVPEAEAEKPKIVDLMAALEASVEAAKTARKRHPAASQGQGEEVGVNRRAPAAAFCPSANRPDRADPDGHNGARRWPSARRSIAEVDGRQLELSNLDKVLYPSGFTKGEVIDYYARIAPVAVPHLRGRALTFRRFPNGTDEPGLLREALPEPPPRVGAGRPRARRPPRRHRVLLHRGDGGAGVGRQHGGDRAARPDGAGRRPRHAARRRVRLRPRAAHRHHRLLRHRAAGRATSSPPSTSRAGARRRARRGCSCTCR